MPDALPPLTESPVIRQQLEALVTESIFQMMETLSTGSGTERRAVMKMVLTEVFRASKDSTGVDAEKLLEQTRAVIAEGVLGGVDVTDDEADEDGEPDPVHP